MFFQSSLLFFGCVYITTFSFLSLMMIHDVNHKTLVNISTSVCGLIHGVVTTLLSLRIILEHPPFCFDHKMTVQMEHLILFSLSYFLVDLCVSISNIFNGGCKMTFFVHHLCSILIYIIILGWVPQSGMVVVYCVFLAECTNPLYNVCNIANAVQCKILSSIVEPIFTYLFRFVRCLLLPCLYISILNWDGYIRMYIVYKLLLIVPGTVILIGGVVWVYNDYYMYH